MTRSKGIFPVCQNRSARYGWSFRDHNFGPTLVAGRRSRLQGRLSRLFRTAFTLAQLLRLRIWQMVLTLFPKLALWIMLRSKPQRSQSPFDR